VRIEEKGQKGGKDHSRKTKIPAGLEGKGGGFENEITWLRSQGKTGNITGRKGEVLKSSRGGREKRKGKFLHALWYYTRD